MKTNKLYITSVLPLNDDILFQKAYNIVSDLRKQKIDNHKFKKDKCLSLGTEILLYKALTELNVFIKDIEFSFNEHNKPYLLNQPNIFFNLSHSGNYAICAVSSDETGCDIEELENTNLKIAKKFFHPNEYKLLTEETNIQKQQELFFRLWTLKESFVKNIGTGINLGFDKFEIVMKDEISIIQNFNNTKYYFTEINSIKNYKCAVCSKFKEINICNTDIKTILSELS